MSWYVVYDSLSKATSWETREEAEQEAIVRKIIDIARRFSGSIPLTIATALAGSVDLSDAEHRASAEALGCNDEYSLRNYFLEMSNRVSLGDFRVTLSVLNHLNVLLQAVRVTEEAPWKVRERETGSLKLITVLGPHNFIQAHIVEER